MKKSNNVTSATATKRVPTLQSINKSTANKNWKDATRSISAICNYAKKQGKSDTMKLIADVNKRRKLTGDNRVTLKDIAVPNLIVHMTDKQLVLKSGEKRELFSYWATIVLTVGRMAKAKAGINWRVQAKKAVNTVKTVKGNLPSMASLPKLRAQAKRKGIDTKGVSRIALHDMLTA